MLAQQGPGNPVSKLWSVSRQTGLVSPVTGRGWGCWVAQVCCCRVCAGARWLERECEPPWSLGVSHSDLGRPTVSRAVGRSPRRSPLAGNGRGCGASPGQRGRALPTHPATWLLLPWGPEVLPEHQASQGGQSRRGLAMGTAAVLPSGQSLVAVALWSQRHGLSAATPGSRVTEGT